MFAGRQPMTSGAFFVPPSYVFAQLCSPALLPCAGAS
jgi:hypothetical protein